MKSVPRTGALPTESDMATGMRPAASGSEINHNMGMEGPGVVDDRGRCALAGMEAQA